MDYEIDLALQPEEAEFFARLEGGERLEAAETSVMREGLMRLLNKIRELMFSSLTDEHRAWIRRQQIYTGRIVDALEKSHFGS